MNGLGEPLAHNGHFNQVYKLYTITLTYIPTYLRTFSNPVGCVMPSDKLGPEGDPYD